MDELPRWLAPLLDAETMRAVERWAIDDRGVPGIELMERAGAGVTRASERLAPDGPVAVLCGKGNNGGDGLVVARLLRDSGREVSVICVAPPEELTGDARTNLECLPGPAPLAPDGVPWSQREDPVEASGRPLAELLAAHTRVVDALLGTGFQGEPRGEFAGAIDALLASGAPVLSVDVPSGVDASNGTVPSRAARARRTVTFHTAKPGHWINPGKEHAGEVEVVDIGIPRGAPASSALGLIEGGVLAELRHRTAAATKFSSGHVLVAGGSRGLTGAPTMAARASMRAGAGYVTVCVPDSLQAIVAASGAPELMSRGLAEDPPGEGSVGAEGVDEVLDAARPDSALALGPGLGRREGAVSFARALAQRAQLAMVLDADGLNAHAGRLRDLAARSAPTALTPHAGELARLLGCGSDEIERERLRHARAAAEASGAVVVLKGDDTLVARPDGAVAVSPGGAPALATAGTGDVLSGVIAALLAQGLDAFTAAAAGVFMHVEAGRRAARALGSPDAVIATDVIASLPRARSVQGVGDGDG